MFTVELGTAQKDFSEPHDHERSAEMRQVTPHAREIVG